MVPLRAALGLVIVLVAYSTGAAARFESRRSLLQSTICGTNCYFTDGYCSPNPTVLVSALPPTSDPLISKIVSLGNAEALQQTKCCGAATASACAAISSCSWDNTSSACLVDNHGGIDFGNDVIKNYLCPGTVAEQLFACLDATAATCAATQGCTLVAGSTCTLAALTDPTQSQSLTQGFSNFSPAVWGNCPIIQLLRAFQSACNYTTSADCSAKSYCAWQGDGSTGSCALTPIAGIEFFIPNTDSFGQAFYRTFGSCYANTNAQSCVGYSGPMNVGDPTNFSLPADLATLRASTGVTTSGTAGTGSSSGTGSASGTGNSGGSSPGKNSATKPGASLVAAAVAAGALALMLA